MNKIIFSTVLCFTLNFGIFSTQVYAQQSAIDNGLSYLQSTQSTDGSWGGTPTSLNTIHQSTSTTARTLQNLGITDTTLTNALSFLSSQSPNTVDDLAEQLEALAASGADVSVQVASLKAAQQADGGWGLDLDLTFKSEIIDTVSALRALSVANAADGATVSKTLGYLLGSQNLDGGWGLTSGKESLVYTTARVLDVLSEFASTYNINTTINNAVSYLLGQQTTTGNWDNSVFLSALSYIALHDFIPTEPTASGLITYLSGQQAANGSWEDDPYSTALAIRALHLSQIVPANPTLGIIKGKIIDAQTGLPLSGAAVDLSGPTPQSLVTASNGLFEFRDLESGNYSIAFSLSDYLGFTTTTQLNPDQTVDLGTLQMSKDAEPESGTLRGTITDSVTGQPLEGAKITVTGVANPTFTVADGSYQATNVPSGIPVTATIEKDGYITAIGRGTISPGTIAVYSPALVAGVPQSAAKIQGIIKDGATGLPLEGVSIHVSDIYNTTVFTDAQGAYQTPSLIREIYTVTASLMGYDSVAIEVDAVLNNTITFSPKLYPEGTTPPGANTAGVTGIVVGAGTNTPLSNVTVTSTSGTSVQTLQTDSDGRFTLSGFTSSSTDLQFTLEGYAPSNTNILLDPLQVLDIGQVRMRVETVVQLLPDLKILSIDRSATGTDLITLNYSGTLTLEVGNKGTATAPSNIALLAFHDSNRNNTYDPGVDLLMGQTTIAGGITVDGTATASLSVEGVLPFLDAPVHVWIDSGQAVAELKEDNNIETTASACESKPDIGTFNPVLKWAWEGSTVQPNHRQVMSIPIIAPTEDTNGDGLINEDDIPSVIFHTFQGGGWGGNGILRAVSGKDGHDLWSVINLDYRTNASGAIAVADIDNDGLIEILVGRNGTGLLAFEHDGTFKWQSLETGVINWGGPAIADLDADGTPEIIVGDIVLNADGTRRWAGPAGADFRLSIVADINLDGRPEIIADGKAYTGTGELLWQNPAITSRAFSAIGNFNSDPYPEIAVTFNSKVYLLDHLGAIIWGPVLFPGTGGGAPTVADMDGDGLPEIGVAGARRYVVFDTDGSILWQATGQDASSASTGSSVFDFDGDGSAEVVYGDELFLRVYKGGDGALLFEVPNTSGTTYELPVVVDVDHDNHADIVVATNDYFTRGFGSGIRVYKDQNNSWVDTRKIWNQHSYHITNINDDGTVPALEENSWQTHNTYRLNAKPEGGALRVPDLSTSRLQVLDNGTGQALSLSVRVGNGGAISSPEGVTLSFYRGDPNAGGILLGSKTIGVLSLGAYQDVILEGVTGLSSTDTVFAVVDPDSQVIECSETNNTAQASPAMPQSFLGDIAVSTDQPSYAANEAVVLSAVVSNLGALTGAFNAELRVEDENGATLQTFGPQDIGALTGGASRTFTETWNTGTFFSGSYHLKGLLRDSSGATLSVATSPFTILPGNGATSSIVSDKARYSSNESVRLTSVVTSQSVNSALTGLGAIITVLDPSGALIYSETRPLSDLLPGARIAFNSFTNTSSHQAGFYTASIVVNSNGNSLTTASTSFEVVSSLTQANALSGTITVSPNSILETESTTLSYSIQNSGNEVDLPLIDIEILVVDPDSGLAVRTITDETSLNGVEVYSNDILFDSTGLSPKPYLIVLRGTTAGITQTLASAGLQVNPSPNSAPTANAGPDQFGLTGQSIALDGTASSDPDGDVLSFQWHFVSVPEASLVTNAALDDPTLSSPSFIPDLEGIYTLSLVVNDGQFDSPEHTVSIFINPAPQVKIHPETINLKSNGGSKSVTGVLSSPVLSSFAFLTAEDGVTVTADFVLENRYIDPNGDLVIFSIPADSHPASDFIEGADADGNGEIGQYRLTLKFNRDLLIAGVTDENGALRISDPTDLISTVIGDGIAIGSDTNTMIAPPKVSKGNK